jgi:protein-disulfide isomerase
MLANRLIDRLALRQADLNIGGRMEKLFARLANVVLILAAGVFVGKVVTARVSPPDQGLAVPRERLSFVGAATLGSPGARVGVVEFSDFQCPFCARAAQDTIPLLLSHYVATGTVRFAVRHMALSVVHHFAARAAAGATCAGLQEQFWSMHDALFRNQATLSDEHIRELGRGLGLDMTAFEACWDVQGRLSVAADGLLGVRLGVRTTPTFLVGKIGPDGLITVQRTMEGVPASDELRRAIDMVGSS